MRPGLWELLRHQCDLANLVAVQQALAAWELAGSPLGDRDALALPFTDHLALGLVDGGEVSPVGSDGGAPVGELDGDALALEPLRRVGRESLRPAATAGGVRGRRHPGSASAWTTASRRAQPAIMSP